MPYKDPKKREEYKKNYNQKYYQDNRNKEKEKQRSKNRYTNNEKYKKYKQQKVREYKKNNKQKAAFWASKRNRNMGFFPLNSWYINSEGHHMNSEHVIYVPSEIHKHHYHNHNKPETMRQINKIAFFHLMNEMIS